MDYVDLVEVHSTFDDPKSDLHDLTKVSYKELRSTGSAVVNSGLRRKVTT